MDFGGKSDDYFEFMIKFHRFFGLSFIGIYAKESKLKICCQLIYQIAIHSYIIALTVPCLTHNLICMWFSTHTPSANRQIFIHFGIRNCICLISGIVYSLKGKQFQELISKLRKTLQSLDPFIEQREDTFATNRRLFYCMVVSLLIYVTGMAATTYNLNYITTPLPLYVVTIIAELFGQPILFATDFYLLYFTFYIELIQKSFGQRIALLATTQISEIDIRLIRKEFNKIQTLIDMLSSLLSPMLVLICGSIFSDTMISFYFITKIIESGRLLTAISFWAPFMAFSFITIRLALISVISDKINIENRRLIKMVEEFDNCPNIKSEIKMISLQQVMRSNAKCVNASGLFAIGKPLILSILGLTVSYGVILIQSDGSPDVYSITNTTKVK